MANRRITKRISRPKSQVNKPANSDMENTKPNVYHIYKLPIWQFLTSKEQEDIRAVQKELKDFNTAMRKLRKSKKEYSEEEKATSKQIKDKQDIIEHSLKNDQNERIFPENKLLNKKNQKNKHYIVGTSQSILTRTLKWQDKQKKDTDIMDDVIVLSANVDAKDDKYAKILLKKFVINGFTFKNNKYVFFTASAGQIRGREAMFIKKAEYDKVKNTLTCGLTWDRINNPIIERAGNKGIIANKYLAYSALCSSTSKLFKELSVDKCIVVKDFGSDVPGLVDYVTIDKENYSITRQNMEVPITHTDGCGMILPSKSKEAFTIRGPWFKGLLVPFKFDLFIKEADKADPSVNHGLVQDIYGDWHDILEEKIEVIFTESQFKMWKYFKDWNEYKNNFHKYGCQFAKCKTQKETVKPGKTSYQYLQTLTDITSEELKTLCNLSNKELTRKCTDYKYMYESHSPKKKSEVRPLWNAVNLYPALLIDSHTKAELRKEAESFCNNCLGGKLRVEGYNTFVVPDLFAFCEHLFLKKDKPEGLIPNGEVSCSLYDDKEKLDCLRSPHWSREHAIRYNRINQDCKKWFCKEVCFFSCHDVITRILQADFDGDASLVVNDKTLVEAAERNMQGVAPLYYPMSKGDPKILTKENLYEGMVAAYKYSIGALANPLSKLWSHNPKGKELEYIKVFTAASNFYVDYAKTLQAPVLPKEITNEKTILGKEAFPYFWQYTDNFKKAKKKKDEQLKYYEKNRRKNEFGQDEDIDEIIEDEVVNDESKGTSANVMLTKYLHAGIKSSPSDLSTVDKVSNYIQDKPYIDLHAFKADIADHIDYTLLMCNHKQKIDTELYQKVIAEYKESARTDALAPDGIDLTSEVTSSYNSYGCSILKTKLHAIEPDSIKVTDMLITYLFGPAAPEARKSMFWQCYGNIICENLKRNLEGTKVCQKCLKMFKVKADNEFICPDCK
ncbi:MAG: hypothetical protein VB078_09080 [Clostridiaceae bacterium]|nr:hypothetical protein [Clostridiaceae bacterium]